INNSVEPRRDCYDEYFSEQEYTAAQDLHSFPTRRSSDLRAGPATCCSPTWWPSTSPAATWPSGAGPLSRPAASISSIAKPGTTRSEEHTSELQSREKSYAVFCLKKKNKNTDDDTDRDARS